MTTRMDEVREMLVDVADRCAVIGDRLDIPPHGMDAELLVRSSRHTALAAGTVASALVEVLAEVRRRPPSTHRLTAVEFPGSVGVPTMIQCACDCGWHQHRGGTVADGFSAYAAHLPEAEAL
jgi:hypothetical protein